MKTPMTPEGLQKLKDHLKFLKGVKRPKILEALEVARSHGDLSENAEYDAAKEARAHLEMEIRETESKIASAEVIDPAKMDHGHIAFGATVTLEDTENGNKVTYQIVGDHESNIQNGKISVASPVARALIGKAKGDLAQVRSPKGIREYEVLSIEYK